MNAKHTPGPWSAGNPPHDMTVYANCVPIAATRDGDCYEWSAKRWLYPENAKANARLIASAPDLLEACRNLENDDGSIPAHAWSLIQAAINKAEGGAE